MALSVQNPISTVFACWLLSLILVVDAQSLTTYEADEYRECTPDDAGKVCDCEYWVDASDALNTLGSEECFRSGTSGNNCRYLESSQKRKCKRQDLIRYFEYTVEGDQVDEFLSSSDERTAVLADMTGTDPENVRTLDSVIIADSDMRRNLDTNEVDCDSCVAEFSSNGGCECMNAEQGICDATPLIPEGCDSCGNQASTYCHGRVTCVNVTGTYHHESNLPDKTVRIQMDLNCQGMLYADLWESPFTMDGTSIFTENPNFEFAVRVPTGAIIWVNGHTWFPTDMDETFDNSWAIGPQGEETCPGDNLRWITDSAAAGFVDSGRDLCQRAASELGFEYDISTEGEPDGNNRAVCYFSEPSPVGSIGIVKLDGYWQQHNNRAGNSNTLRYVCRVVDVYQLPTQAPTPPTDLTTHYSGSSDIPQLSTAAPEEIVSLISAVEGVTEINKDDVCISIASALGGSVEYCSLEGPSTRRRMQTTAHSTTLYTDIAVTDPDAMKLLLEADDFLETLQNLPSGVQIVGVTPLGEDGMCLSTMDCEDGGFCNFDGINVGICEMCDDIPDCAEAGFLTSQGTDSCIAACETESMTFWDNVLYQHNYYRCLHDVPLMVWDDEIAASAQSWADELGGTMQHSSFESRQNIAGFNQLGENLYWTSRSYEDSGVESVVMWYDEIELTENSEGIVSEFSGQTGHYTQVVWKTSTSLGCGGVNGLIVCQYGPSGNYHGQFTENVQAPTVPESECANIEIPEIIEAVVIDSSSDDESQSVIVPSSNEGTSEFWEKILDEHNLYRCQHGVPLLNWDADIAANAQGWADETGGTMQLSTFESRQNVAGFSMLGENQFWSSQPYEDTGIQSITMWYDQVSLTDGGLVPDFNPETGHYTQVVWKSSTSLGCGGAGGLIVCQYGPSGNYMGQFTENVLAPSVPESECLSTDETDSHPSLVDGTESDGGVDQTEPGEQEPRTGEVVIEMTFSGLTSDNFEEARPAIKQTVAEIAGAPLSNVDVRLLSEETRRYLQDSSIVEATVATSNVEATWSALSSADDATFQDTFNSIATDAGISDIVLEEIDSPVPVVAGLRACSCRSFQKITKDDGTQVPPETGTQMCQIRTRGPPHKHCNFATNPLYERRGCPQETCKYVRTLAYQSGRRKL